MADGGNEGAESRPDPRDQTVLVTGAGGFVGGHVARALARSGYRVRAFSRKAPDRAVDDPPIDWVVGDLGRARDVAGAVKGVGGVVHSAGWVSLGRDPRGLSRPVNVDATRLLLDLCEGAGVERFVYTSTLWTTAAGTPSAPADESSPWNLEPIRSPYSETKREAERLVLARNGSGFRTTAICPGMVLGPGDRRPSSTKLLLTMASNPVAILPRGGIPVVDVHVLAEAHVKALASGAPGERYIVVGPYLSYREIARLVEKIAGRPKVILDLPDCFRRGFCGLAEFVGRASGGRLDNVSAAAVAGGYLRLHVSGAKADATFGLTHPAPARSIFEALDDHRRTGRVSWLNDLRAPEARDQRPAPHNRPSGWSPQLWM